MNLRGGMDSNTIIMKDFSAPFLSMTRSPRQNQQRNNRDNLHYGPK